MATTSTAVEKKRTKLSKKTRVQEPEAIGAASLESPAQEESADTIGAIEGNGKKRKREVVPEDELEIDVSLPEPLSKKAARKAKKPKSSTAADTSNGSNGQPTPQDVEQAERRERRTSWGIWIGNLPWSVTKQELRDFICATGTIKPEEITRVHMPAPKEKAPRHGDVKYNNKGFAYVDVDSAEALEEALKLTETAMDSTHRKVLIKNANSFEGRPDPKATEGATSSTTNSKVPSQKPPSRRVFVGNLSFDMTKEELGVHFSQCGGVTDVHMATFEDSGKCKGFAWITFDSVEAGTAAARGYILKTTAEDSDSDGDEGEEEAKNDAQVSGEEDNKSRKKARRAPKPRKWYVNKLQGRMLRCEFAEDPSVRYKKRFGKDAPNKDDETINTNTNADADADEMGGASAGTTTAPPATRASSTPHDRRREARRSKREFVKVDARTIKPGAALSNAPRASAAIVPSTGSKITFD